MSEKDERYLPEELAERVRKSLGTIHLDPMSCEEANRIVKANRIYTKEDDGLSKPWRAPSVYLNPPGSLRLDAHRRFVSEYREERFSRGCVCLYDWDHSTQWFQVIADLNPVWVLLKNRWKFSGKDVGRSQAFAFVGEESISLLSPETLREVWGDIALVGYLY